MCEVNDDGQGGQAPIQEDDALEKIFSECDGSSTGKVLVAKLMDYMFNQMSAHGSPEILNDLRKSMCAVSYNGEVTRQQYYDVSRSWLAKIRKGQHHHENHQDGNNNLRIDESSRATSPLTGYADDATVSSEPGPDIAPTLHEFLELSTSTIVDTSKRSKNEDSFFGDLSSVSGNYYLTTDDPIFETTRDLQLRMQRCTVENDHLKEELQRSEDSIALLERQLGTTRRKLEMANEKCVRLQTEDEEHHAELSKTERDRQALRARNQHLERKNFLMRRELDDAVTETERLRFELDKLNDQKEARGKLLSHYREELQQVQKLYEGAKEHISQMDLANCQLKDENQVSTRTIEQLKTIVKELETRVSELQTHRDDMSHSEPSSARPVFKNELSFDLDTSHYSGKIIPRSLCDEMKASGLEDPDISLTNKIETLDEKMEDQCITEYYSVIREAVKQLERVLARVQVACNKVKAKTVPARNPSFVFGEIDADGNKECRSSVEELLRMLESEIRRTLSIFSIVVSHKVVSTNASTTDPATRVDVLEPDSTPVCDILRGINTGFINHDLSTNWGTEKHPHKEKEKRVASLAEVKSGDASAAATSTPRSSPLPYSSRRSSSLEVCEEAIIDPIVAALDEIIQSSGCANGDPDLAHSPRKSLREHKSRYVQTPASRREFECGCSSDSCDVESPPSLITADAESRLSNATVTGWSESGSELNCGFLETCAWRCQGTEIMDDSSDDKESSLRYSLDKALVTVTRVDPTLHTTDSRDPSPLTITRTDPTPGTYRTEPTLAPIQHSVAGSGTSSCEDNGCDVVEDLNVDLEKLTLRTTSSIERHPVEKKSAGNFQPYDNVPKRKSSVYHQFFDPCKLDGGRDTSVRRSTNSLRVRKYTRSNQGTKCNKLLSRPSRKLAEPLISDSETFSNNFCRAESEDYLASLSAGSGQLDMDNVRPFSPTPIGHQVSTEKNDEISTIYSSDDGGRVKSAPTVMAQTETTCNVSPTIPQRGSFMFDSAQCNGTDDSHARIDFISGTTESSVELLSLNICETTVVSEIEDVNPVESRATHRTVTRYTEPDETVKPLHDEDLTEPSGPSYVSIAGVDIPMAESEQREERQQSYRVLESMLPGKPSKSEASLESCRTTYAIMGARSFQLQTPTFCPSNHEILGDVALANVERGRSNDCEISPRSRSVERAMSSEEDSSDSECARDQIDCEDNVQVVVPPRPSPPSRSTSPPPLLSPIRPHQPPQTEAASSHPCNQNVISAFAFQEPPPPPYRDRTENRVAEESVENRKHRLKKTERLRRSLSEGDNSACRESFRCRCSCGCSAAQSRILDVPGGTGDTLEACEHQLNLGAFPNLPDARLIELGLSDPPYGHELCDRISEDELERKYTALSIGLGTDRATLPRRLALSLRQRDQAERNLATEVGRMQRDIQALAPLCVDRESVERVERVRHQLEMISRCALRVSCTAELLGATHQERRVSRATLLADRYLQALRARCDKLAAELAETKRILIDNNIVVEENPSELVDDGVPRVRYRGIPPASRTATVSRRRASIATISRPATVNSLQEALTKATPHHIAANPTRCTRCLPIDNARQQRVSISGRMTLRRPSLSYDTQRWDEKLDRTDSSSSSVGELREIFEQAESRRGSKEENNNLIRRQLNNFSVAGCESGDSDTFISTRGDSTIFQTQVRDEELLTENTSPRRRVPPVYGMLRDQVSRLPVFWYILFVAVFFFGFYSNRYVTTRYMAPLKWWSIEEIFQRYGYFRRNPPPPV
ncbi:uncharacterized protein LOC107220650 isoform X1 [Neodiprion lecontei]|uniref:Uncharacterized protein LOC107220650 isoform X1 n=1 Tax=Neodiprion lecontei TaxID=441921 RepID=A0ABM3GFU5_NEOLC|nr:uncharacterized protein LOC107220650 isoform X1 [Neodiprion lecontei]